MYDTGKKTVPPLAILSSTAFFYLARKAHVAPALFDGIVDGLSLASHGVQRGRVGAYTLAGILSIGIIPYTFAVLLPTNKRLLRKVEVLGSVEMSKEDEEEQRD